LRFTTDTPTLLTVVKRAEDRDRGQAILQQAARIFAGAGPAINSKIRVGHAAEEIVAEAREGQYGLVIVGERPYHNLVTRVLGSTAIYVVERSPCSVIIAKGRIKPVHRILLCDSGGLDPDVLTRFTLNLTERITGEEDITVLHVMSQITAAAGLPDEELRADADRLMQAQAPEGQFLERDLHVLAGSPIHPVAKVRHGPVVDEILQEACEGDYDLVVVGAHRDQGWQRWLLEDITHQIITHMDRPVLVVR
jgi:nucleotide-binding universal stress UspA family protein